MKAPLENTKELQQETVQRVEQESSTGGEGTIADNRPAIAVQRKLRSVMGGADDTDNPIQRKNNTGLPDNLKSGIENLSGYNMGDVKVHYNSSKPAQLQAHAYAQGTDIHLAPGQEKHLPHEAWHVVQQKQGRVQPTRQLKSKVNINDSIGLEKEADVMGACALKRGQQIDTKGNHTYQLSNGNTAAVNNVTVVQRFKVGEEPIKNPFQDILTHYGWFPKAKAYEQRLGAYCATHPKSNYALNLAIQKLMYIVNSYYAQEIKDKDISEEDMFREVFFRDDETSSGQVGINLDIDKIFEVLQKGNLRERMTAFYNASYYGSGYGKDIKRGFKQILHEIIFNNKNELIKDLNLNEEKIKEQHTFYNNPSFKDSAVRRLAKWKAPEEWQYLFYDDVFALGNLSIQGRDTSVKDSQQAKKTRKQPIDPNVHPELIKTPADFEELGVPLSDNELAFLYEDEGLNLNRIQKKKKRNEARRKGTRDKQLPWISGNAMFELSPDDSWYQKIHDQLRMPVVAGVSGTTTRMLKSYQFLNIKNSELNFRLALMGWMLPTWDHSLYEILKGSHIAGVNPPGEKERITDVIKMYMNIAPLQTDELRNHVGNEGMFPHEEQYTEIALRRQPVVLPALPNFRTTERHADQINSAHDRVRQDDGKEERTGFNKAHTIATGVYSGGMHKLFNTVLEMWQINTPHIAIKYALKSKLLKLADRVGRGEAVEFPAEMNALNMIVNYLNREDFNRAKRNTERAKIKSWIDGFVEDIYPEIQMHINIMTQGLTNLPSSNKLAYRGTTEEKLKKDSWRLTALKVGSIINYNSFQSFSTQRNVAQQFADNSVDQGEGTTRVLLRVQLSGHAGKDIKVASWQQAEDEVLLMPGARIEITGISKQKMLFTDRRNQRALKEFKVYEAKEIKNTSNDLEITEESLEQDQPNKLKPSKKMPKIKWAKKMPKIELRKKRPKAKKKLAVDQSKYVTIENQKFKLGTASGWGNNCLIFSIAKALNVQCTSKKTKEIRKNMIAIGILGVGENNFLANDQEILTAILQSLGKNPNTVSIVFNHRNNANQWIEPDTLTYDNPGAPTTMYIANYGQYHFVPMFPV
ncbi:eCIS core domain-containing protein [Aquimarina sp. 2304DJ70-9]|uniref:eCIS core domain-containing protein n=1 Tax=Aquimarina penaris TaxID=3231044 RepID=UPI003461DC07